jgi:ribosomal protein S27E
MALSVCLEAAGSRRSQFPRGSAYYLLLGAYLSVGCLWFWQVKWERKPRVKVQTGRDGFWKMSCPGCGGHVKFAIANEGHKIPCPHCAKLLTLAARRI